MCDMYVSICASCMRAYVSECVCECMCIDVCSLTCTWVCVRVCRGQRSTWLSYSGTAYLYFQDSVCHCPETCQVG